MLSGHQEFSSKVFPFVSRKTLGGQAFWVDASYDGSIFATLWTFYKVYLFQMS